MINVQIDKQFVTDIKELMERRDEAAIKHTFAELYPADIAELFYEINLEEAIYLMTVIDRDKAVDVLAELEVDKREKILTEYDSQQIATLFIDHMNSDDAVDIINEMPIQRAEEVISYMTDKDFAKSVVSLLHYDDSTAGGLMAKELVKVNMNWTVNECTDEIRQQAEHVDQVYSVYVVDDYDRLLGRVSLKSIILSSKKTPVSEVYDSDIHMVFTHTSGEEIASMMKKYDLIVLPVVDALGRLVGRITIDDVVDFMKDEADKDYQLMSGISENVESSDRVWILSRARLPWLMIGLLGGIASSRVVGVYEPEMAAFPQMAFFIPLVAAMGGNAGVQSSAIIVQGLANNTLGNRSILPKIAKEFFVALINGLICAAIIFGYNYIIGNHLDLSLTVSLSLLSVIIFATILGSVIPLLLDRAKIDPALATGPFITTTNDLLGIALYFLLGSLFLGNL